MNRFALIFSILMLVGTAVRVHAQSTPEDLVKSLYRAHDAKSIVDQPKAEIGKFFDARLTGIISKAIKREDGIDFDILYDAQDTEIKHFVVGPATSSTATRAVVPVTFLNFGKKELIRFEVRNTDGKGWRVSEITYKSGRTVSSILSKS